ncbi:MAG: hypothetical protein A2Y73_05245 [Chloroflexi bacterium RBG_13_56_8]|nr:MAG: hypothetical protein A2Y73_05245 [Chloroflexi bacterium RBG_13_56_8]
MQTSHDEKKYGCGIRFLQGLAILLVITVLVMTGYAAGIATMWRFGYEIRAAVANLVPESAGQPIPERIPEEDFDLLDKVWGILGREFHDPDSLDEQKMIYGAAMGLASSLEDPYTMFVEPMRAAILADDMQGSFEGIGATVSMLDGQLIVVEPLPNSPALEAGIQAGDVILAVDDEPLEGKSYFEAIALIRGPRGTVVRLLVKREGTADLFTVPVTRGEVEVPIVEARITEEGIAYLRLREFNALSENRVHSALDELLQADPIGLILDLRDNPGGFLEMSVAIASEFLPEDTLVVSQKERDKPLEQFRVEHVGIATEIPLVVLIDGSSASASEIVAGAIRDHQRGVLIGEQTFGKGSVQSVHALEDGSSLRVTVAKWYLPNGDNLDSNGIQPDIEVVLTPDDAIQGKDPQLDRAI